MLLPRIAVLVIFAGSTLCLPACNRIGDGRFNSALAEAEKRLSGDDFEGAIRVYESSLDGTARTAEAHYRLGHVYADRLKEPLGALYHFTRYVAIAPDGPYAKEAKSFQKEGELLVLTQLSKGAPLTQEEAARMKNENLKLRKTLEELRLVKTPAPGGSVAAKGGDLSQKPIPPGARTHKVAAGETLASIAVKYYKNKSRWKDIQEANFYSAEAAKKLKLGQELVIP